MKNLQKKCTKSTPGARSAPGARRRRACGFCSIFCWFFIFVYDFPICLYMISVYFYMNFVYLYTIYIWIIHDLCTHSVFFAYMIHVYFTCKIYFVSKSFYAIVVEPISLAKMIPLRPRTPKNAERFMSQLTYLNRLWIGLAYFPRHLLFVKLQWKTFSRIGGKK